MNKRLRIIISNYDDIHNPYYSGGGAHAMHEIGKRLAKRHDVTIIVGSYSGCRDARIDGVQYIHRGISFGGPLLGQLVFALSLPVAVLTKTCDVWFENFVPPHSTNMLPIFTKKPVIGITSLLDAEKFSEKYHIPFYLIENYGLGLYRHIIALSSSIAERIRKHNTHGDVRIIPDGIATEYLSMATKELPYVYFLGRLDPFQKGLDILLPAWKLVVKKYPDMRLIIAGEGTPKDHAKVVHMITALGLNSVVSLPGRVSGTIKNDIMRQSMAAVFPSRFESFGIAPLEALAIGKPMVCFDIDGFSWIDRDVCVKVPKKTPQALAEALEMVIGKKTMRQVLSRKARVFARPFTWDAIARQYEQFAWDVCEATV